MFSPGGGEATSVCGGGEGRGMVGGSRERARPGKMGGVKGDEGLVGGVCSGPPAEWHRCWAACACPPFQPFLQEKCQSY